MQKQEADPQPDVEPKAGESLPPISDVKPATSRKSLAKISRELRDEDLASPVAQKMMLDELERLEAECEKGKSHQADFHRADKECAVLREKLKSNKAVEVVILACSTLGGIALGFSTTTNWQVGALGAILVVAGIVSKTIKQ